MKSKSLAQLVLFVLITAFWLKIAWPLMTKEALALGAVGGLLVHRALTNKGSKAVALIEPGTSGWRVMLYDMMLVAFLAALALLKEFGLVDTFFSFLKQVPTTLKELVNATGGV